MAIHIKKNVCQCNSQIDVCEYNIPFFSKCLYSCTIQEARKQEGKKKKQQQLTLATVWTHSKQ